MGKEGSADKTIREIRRKTRRLRHHRPRSHSQWHLDSVDEL
jgi:hypothetical protein